MEPSQVFTKALFEQVPEDYFKRADHSDWFNIVTDYVTMLPMAELAKKSVYLDSGYAYWHLRQNSNHDNRQQEDKLISELLSKPSLLTKEDRFAEQTPVSSEGG